MPLGTDLPVGRLVFFFTDIEGSTRLLTDLGDAFAPLLGEHQRLVRASLLAHGGIEISTEGDSFFAVFRAPLDAVAAAADSQRRLAAEPWPTGHELRVRIGVHVGQAVLAGDTYVGIDVNRAARIANAANGGQVVLSDETVDAVAGELPAGLALLDLGRHRLRDVGVARLWQLEIDGLATRRSPLRTLEAHPSNLPADATPLVDRRDEVAALQRLILDGPLATVTGSGGIGKSRLAVETARTLLAEFPDGVFYLDLDPIDRVSTVLVQLAALLDIAVPPGGDAADALFEHLEGRRALLVLETVDRHPGIASVVARIAEACPSVRLLVTARSPLHLRAERELSVQPLGLPGRRATIEMALASPAVDLFVQRAQAVDHAFRLSDANVDAVSAIVQRLDGLPLAVELAAAATRLLSPGAILARLARSLPLPGGAAIDAPERQRTLRDTIAWSYQLLDPDERATLQRLSVFAGDFDLDAVAAVADDGPTRGGTASDGLEHLERLVDRSLVHRVAAGEDDRYRLLGTIREFAADELRAAGVSDVARSRHARYWLGVVSRAAALLDGPEELGAFAVLDRAGDDVRAALLWALDAVDAEHLGLRLSSVMGRSWYLRGRAQDAETWLDRALAADPDAPPALRAQALHWLGVMLDERRDAVAAIDRLEEALAIEREIGDERAIARELNSLGVAARNGGAGDRAESLLTESLARRRALGDSAGIATVLTNLGILAIDRGQLERAIELLSEALALDRASGATGGVAYSASSLAAALLEVGRRDEALGLVRIALAAFHQLDDAEGMAENLERLGKAMAAGEPGRAARLVLAARSIRDRRRIRLRAIDEVESNELAASVTASVTPAELEMARADVNAMDVDAAVAYALAALG